eukprot:TRINITY_DN1472_c2_g1_i2.p1 TRINITY_DN1472_c2_g1~~TRINITY_DN1472_c2_g1_i2.p1  ORF type:complete len:948 (+),score=198.77 TRINITY_DN1472_c2_g1_i2:66-2846(+)
MTQNQTDTHKAHKVYEVGGEKAGTTRECGGDGEPQEGAPEVQHVSALLALTTLSFSSAFFVPIVRVKDDLFCSGLVCYPGGSGVLTSADSVTAVFCLTTSIICLLGVVACLLRVGHLLGHNKPHPLGTRFLISMPVLSILAGISSALTVTSSDLIPGCAILWYPAVVFTPLVFGKYKKRIKRDVVVNMQSYEGFEEEKMAKLESFRMESFRKQSKPASVWRQQSEPEMEVRDSPPHPSLSPPHLPIPPHISCSETTASTDLNLPSPVEPSPPPVIDDEPSPEKDMQPTYAGSIVKTKPLKTRPHFKRSESVPIISSSVKVKNPRTIIKRASVRFRVGGPEDDKSPTSTSSNPPRLLPRRSMSLQDLHDGLAVESEDGSSDGEDRVLGRGWRKTSIAVAGLRPPLMPVPSVKATPAQPPPTTTTTTTTTTSTTMSANTQLLVPKKKDDERKCSTVSSAVETELPRPASFHSVQSRPPSEGSACSGRLSAQPVLETEAVDGGFTPNGNKIVSNYVVLGTLGKGSYSKVKLCKSVVTNETRAMKVYKKSLLKHVGRLGGRGSQLATALHKVKQEVAILKKLRHRNLIELHAVLDDADGDKMILVMEYAVRGSIGEVDPATGFLIGKTIPEDMLAHYFLGVVSGLRYLHKCGVVHRDVKPENILIDENNTAKLSDFGVSHVFRPVTGDVLMRTEGTPAYFPPEACAANNQDGYGGVTGDIWALGVTMLTLNTGKHPFHFKDRNTLRNAIQRDQPVIPSTVGPKLTELLTGLLKKDPRWRPSLKEVFYHPFFREREEEGTPLVRTGKRVSGSTIGSTNGVLDRRGSRVSVAAASRLKSPGDYSIDLAYSYLQPSDRSESIPSVLSENIPPMKMRSPNGTEDETEDCFLSSPMSPFPCDASDCNEEPDPPVILSTDLTDAITVVPSQADKKQ